MSNNYDDDDYILYSYIGQQSPTAKLLCMDDAQRSPQWPWLPTDVVSSIMMACAKLDGGSAVSASRCVCKNWHASTNLLELLRATWTPVERVVRAARGGTADIFTSLYRDVESQVSSESRMSVMLEHAVKGNNVAVCKAIMTVPNGCVAADHERLMVLAGRSGYKEICELFLERVSRVTFIRAVDGASSHGHIDTCIFLLGDIYVRYPDIFDALINNCLSDCLNSRDVENTKRVFEYGVEHGASIDRDEYLFKSVACGHKGLTDLFCTLGGRPCARNSRALKIAATNGWCELIILLCDRGRFGREAAKANAGNSGALLNAAQEGHVEACRILVQYGARPTAKNNQALNAAAKKGHYETCVLLLDLGATTTGVELMDNRIHTLLMGAITT